jgi:phosphate/phosphite/phosphonate ABC transporter binding protein
MSRALSAAVTALVLISACNRSPPPAPPPAAPTAEAKAPEVLRPARLVLGFTAVTHDAEMIHGYDGMAKYLSTHLGIPVDVRLARGYAELVELVATRQVQLAMMGPYLYVSLKDAHPGVELLATQIVDGAASYAAYLVTRDDRGISRVEQLRGKRIAFVDRQSTSGYLFPRAYFDGLGLDPTTFFSQVVFSGDHFAALELVLSRKVDAAATFGTALRLATQRLPQGKHLRILAKTGRPPLDAAVACAGLDPSFVARLRETLLALSTRTEEGRRALRGPFPINGFLPTKDEQYAEIRRVAGVVAAADRRSSAAAANKR